MTVTLPEGPAKWSQAGDYNAVDDRMVIAALAGGRLGLVRPPTLAAGSGLVVNLGPWLALVDAQDGTTAVIGDRQARALPVAAGGATARTETLWADVEPDMDPGWHLHILTASELVGRSGLALGTIDTPVNANAASALTLRPGRGLPPLSGGGVSGRSTSSASGTAWTTMASRVIPAGDAVPGSAWELEVWGNGTYASANRQTLAFRAQMGATNMSSFTYGTIAFATSVTAFRWYAKAHIQMLRYAEGAETFAQWNDYVDTRLSMTNENLNPNNTSAGFYTPGAMSYGIDHTVDQLFTIQAQWGGTAGSPALNARAWAFRKTHEILG